MASRIPYIFPAASPFRRHYYGSGGPIETPTPSPRKNKNKRKRAAPVPQPRRPPPFTVRPPTSTFIFTPSLPPSSKFPITTTTTTTTNNEEKKQKQKQKQNINAIHSTFIFRSGVIPEEIASPATPLSISTPLHLRTLSPHPPPLPTPKIQPHNYNNAPQTVATTYTTPKTNNNSNSRIWEIRIGVFMFICFACPFITFLLMHHIWPLCVGFGRYFGLLDGSLKQKEEEGDDGDVYGMEVMADPEVEREWKRRLRGYEYDNDKGDTTSERD